MAPFDPGPRAEFINDSDGYVGAIRYKPNGDEAAISVAPGERVTLSQSEQELTAKSHRDPAKSPFLDQPYEKRDPNTDEIIDEGSKPLLILTSEHDTPWVPGVPGGAVDPRPKVPRDPEIRTARQEQLLQAGEAVLEDEDDDEEEREADGSRDDREEVGTDTPGSTRRRRRSASTA